MTTQTQVHNPFMLMLAPEQVLAAVERSEKLGRLNRRLCQPLDRPVPALVGGDESAGHQAARTPPVDDLN
jgi:hypothetical protein